MTVDSMNISYVINILGENENEGIHPVAPSIYQTSNFYFNIVDQFRGDGFESLIITMIRHSVDPEDAETSFMILTTRSICYNHLKK